MTSVASVLRVDTAAFAVSVTLAKQLEGSTPPNDGWRVAYPNAVIPPRGYQMVGDHGLDPRHGDLVRRRVVFPPDVGLGDGGVDLKCICAGIECLAEPVAWLSG